MHIENQILHSLWLLPILDFLSKFVKKREKISIPKNFDFLVYIVKITFKMSSIPQGDSKPEKRRL